MPASYWLRRLMTRPVRTRKPEAARLMARGLEHL